MVEPRPFEQIQPADINLTRSPQAAVDPQALRPPSRRVWIAWLSGIILVAALLVLFLAPDLIAPPPATPAAVTTTVAPAQPALPSPYEEAQLAEARRSAQDLLAKILARQKTLTELQVQLWGADAFGAAAELSRQGDALYRQRDFVQALERYRQSLVALTDLESQRDQVIAAALEAGQEALARDDEAAASTAFGKVLAIDSSNPTALLGMKQAQLLPQTRPLMAQARQARSADNLQEAQQILKQVLALDPGHREAKSTLAGIQATLVEQRFNSAMSAGLAALKAGRLDSARTEFGKALALKPGHPDARASLDQANARDAAQTLASQLQKAAALEAREQWQEAAALYGTILAKDDTVVQARVGKIRSQTRASLDAGIEAIVTAPLRLSSPSVLRQGQQLLADARAIADPGPRLQGQTAALARALEMSQIPVSITLESDNQTFVTLLRVGEMGTFTSRQLSLKPGNYVALGSRDGYRDVRVEFQVTSEGPTRVVVICGDAV